MLQDKKGNKKKDLRILNELLSQANHIFFLTYIVIRFLVLLQCRQHEDCSVELFFCLEEFDRDEKKNKGILMKRITFIMLLILFTSAFGVRRKKTVMPASVSLTPSVVVRETVDIAESDGYIGRAGYQGGRPELFSEEDMLDIDTPESPIERDGSCGQERDRLECFATGCGTGMVLTIFSVCIVMVMHALS